MDGLGQTMENLDFMTSADSQAELKKVSNLIGHRIYWVGCPNYLKYLHIFLR